MIFIVENFNVFMITPLWTLISLWFMGFIFKDTVTLMQLVLCIVYWLYIATLYATSTVMYYKWKVPEMKKE